MKKNGLAKDDERAAGLRKELNATHGRLLAVHKALVDHEKARYERSWGVVASPMEFLGLLLNHEFFAWLRPVSELIVQLDEAAAPRQAIDPEVAQALLKQARELLVPTEGGETTFGREYHRAIQESAAVAEAHGEWRVGLGE